VGSFPNQAAFRDFPRTDADVPDTALVGLFSSHANELRKVHRHLSSRLTGDAPPAPRGSKRKSQPRLSEEKTLEIVSDYEAGKTVYEIASTHNCHRVTVSAVLKRRGLTLRRTSPTPAQVDEMVRLYESGLPLAKVGEHFGINASTVLAQFRKVGAETALLMGTAGNRLGASVHWASSNRRLG
jgi:DNA invertase Pin-like site-specific DNA recombinase